MQVPHEDPDSASEPRTTTEALSLRARAGGRRELEELYVRTLPSLVAWVELRQRAGIAQRADPSDLAQEVWLRVLQNFERFEPSAGSFRGWMLGIAKNVWLEQANPRRKGGAGLPLASDTVLEAQQDAITSATRAVARDDAVRMFLDYVDTLDPIDRQVILHHGLEGLPCATVATRLEMSADAVSKRWQRVQAKLRESGLGRDLVFDS